MIIHLWRSCFRHVIHKSQSSWCNVLGGGGDGGTADGGGAEDGAERAGDDAPWSGDTGSVGGMSLSGGGEADSPYHGDDGDGGVEDGGGADDDAVWAGDDAMWVGDSGSVEGVETVIVVGFVIGSHCKNWACYLTSKFYL